MLDQALAALTVHPAVLALRASTRYQTAPAGGPPGQPDYLNAAACFETNLDAPQVLSLLRAIENNLGRRRGQRYGPRTIDLDLLLFGAQVIASGGLIVPHPRMALRRFVLVPAAEIASAWVHPTIGWTMGELLAHLDRTAPYVAMAGGTGGERAALAQAVCQKCGGIWLRLESESHDAAGLLESLRRAVGLVEAATWPSDRWTISDFSLAEMAARVGQLAATEPALQVNALLSQSAGAPAPKFTVVLAGSSVLPPATGPILSLPMGDFDAAVEEVLAALAAAK